jgi:plasmid stabilization system protein ParE
MARVEVTTRALADLERLFDFLAEHNPKLARERIVSVRRAFELLADHQLLGREAEDGRRPRAHRPLQDIDLPVSLRLCVRHRWVVPTSNPPDGDHFAGGRFGSGTTSVFCAETICQR